MKHHHPHPNSWTTSPKEHLKSTHNEWDKNKPEPDWNHQNETSPPLSPQQPKHPLNPNACKYLTQSVTNNDWHKEWNKQEKSTTKNECTDLNLPQKKEINKKQITKILTQNMRGVPSNDDTKLKSIIHQIKNQRMGCCSLQETWRLNDDDFHSNGYYIFMHRRTSEKTITRGCVKDETAIILSPNFDLVPKRQRNYHHNACQKAPSKADS